MESVKVIKPSKHNPDRTAAVFCSKETNDYGKEIDLYIVHFRWQGRRTKNTEGKPYEYRTQDKDMAINTAINFVNYH